ncbi:hypothetical protein HKD37_17G048734 [Glycine soja]
MSNGLEWVNFVSAVVQWCCENLLSPAWVGLHDEDNDTKGQRYKRTTIQKVRPLGISTKFVVFGLCFCLGWFFMSRKQNLLCELHTKKGTWKIVVRITDMWRLNKHNGRQSIEMVLMDHTGTKIGATLWQELFPEFEPKLRCGGAYVIQNMKVVDTHSDYKVNAIKYLVYFVKTTSVKEVDRPEIPPNVHAITSFADIISGVAKPDTLVVIERKTVNSAYRVTVKLRDNSHVEIFMTMWEEYALQLDDAIEKNHFVQKPLVVILTLAKIKEPKGHLRVPFYIGGLDDEGGVSQSQSTQNCQDKFLHNAQIVSFGEIKTLQQVSPYCTTTFDPLKIGAACHSCQNHVTHTIPRYKLVVKMEQNGEKANFHFWDAVCIKIFGKTAEECRQELIASGDEIKVFPACVDQLLGKTWVDEQCISNKSADVGVASSSQQDYHPTSSEYDPGNAAFVTPAKRTSDQQGSSQFDSDDFTTYELSTNKHIKDE